MTKPCRRCGKPVQVPTPDTIAYCSWSCSIALVRLVDDDD